MFSDKLLEKIFADKEIQRVPFEYQSTVIHVVERVLDEMGVEIDDTIQKHFLQRSCKRFLQGVLQGFFICIGMRLGKTPSFYTQTALGIRGIPKAVYS